MATNYQLKPFRFNIDDLNFMMAQIKFKPLFDSSGNAIIAWDGTGSIFDAKGVQYNITGMNANAAISIYGTSYATAVSAEGLRDVTGMHNNLFGVHAAWGAVDQPFLQTVASDFSHHLKPVTAGFYGSHTFNLSASAQNTLNAQNLADGPDYTKTVANPGGNNIVDYTPRMISRTITTGGDGNDVIHGEDGGDLIDGGAGDDELFGESSQSSATGVDQIIGGAGNDTIHGAAGIDKLDFSGIDAKVGGFGNGGDQGFTSLLQTTDAFTAAGQLHYHCENIGLANEITVV